jgi:hypothetical protein
MNEFDPQFIALQFNEYINRQDLHGLSNLMPKTICFLIVKEEKTEGKKQ